MSQVVLDVKRLKLNDEEIDGISFMKSMDPKHLKDPEMDHWSLSTIIMSDRDDFTQSELGYKYSIVFYRGNVAEVFEAILGDLSYYVQGLVRKNQEGIIVKKSKKGDEIMNKIFRGRFAEALAAGEVTVG